MSELVMIHLANHPLPKFRFLLKRAKRKFLRSKKGFQVLEEEIQRVRRGSKISRLFRRLFEQKRIKAILGGNLAILVLGISILSPQASALAAISETEVTTLSPGALELTTQVSVRAPVGKIKISQGYHRFHPAIDFDGTTGNPVYPIMKGKVEAVVYHRWALGKHIIVNHGAGLKSVYAHLSKIEVGAGEEVNTNQEIGQIGSSGQAFGDHLHLEVLDSGHHINPLSILPKE